MSIDLHSNGKTSFYVNLIKMLKFYNIPFNFNHDNLDNTKILHFVDHMQKKYTTHWKHSLCNSQKLDRKTLVKLRINNHKLNIETGRYDKISRCDRICPVCSLDIEDEIHFLFDFPKYSSIRDDFFNKIDNKIPNYKHIPIST